MPLVSIIMNVRNGGLFLREALNSLFAQTFQDWELIVWDDHSTDDSAQIVEEYSDSRIRYFLSPEDTPLGVARNAAIRQAGGEWLAFLDQDDVWLPRKLEWQMALATPGTGIIYGRTVIFDSRRGNLRDYDYAHEFQPLPEGDVFEDLFRDACFIAMSSVMLRRTAVEEAGEIPAAIQVSPDYYLYVAVARHYRAQAVQQVVCRYRIHGGSMTQSNRRRIQEEPLWVVNQWAASINPRIVAYRRKTYSTAIALEEIRNPGTTVAGLQRLISQGSFMWLMSRPLVAAWRQLRRKLWRPYWRQSADRAQS